MPDESPISARPPLTILGKRVISVQRWSRRASVRWMVFLVFVSVSLLHTFVRSRGSLLLWQMAAILTIAYVSWPFFHGTYLLHERRTTSMRAGYKVVDNLRLGELPLYRATALRHLGFKFVGCLEKTPDHPLVTTLVAIFIHPENGDSAQLAKVSNSLGSTELVVFNTCFDDGLVLETSNGRRRPIFRPKPKFPTFRFPQVRNLGDLYRVHRAITKGYIELRNPVAATADSALAEFIGTAEEIHSLNANQGDYKLSKSGDHYVYNWKGAFRHSFLHAWPIISIREILVESDANRLCESLGFRVNPKLGRIESS